MKRGRITQQIDQLRKDMNNSLTAQFIQLYDEDIDLMNFTNKTIESKQYASNEKQRFILIKNRKANAPKNENTLFKTSLDDDYIRFQERKETATDESKNIFQKLERPAAKFQMIIDSNLKRKRLASDSSDEMNEMVTAKKPFTQKEASGPLDKSVEKDEVEFMSSDSSSGSEQENEKTSMNETVSERTEQISRKSSDDGVIGDLLQEKSSNINDTNSSSYKENEKVQEASIDLSITIDAVGKVPKEPLAETATRKVSTEVFSAEIISQPDLNKSAEFDATIENTSSISNVQDPIEEDVKCIAAENLNLTSNKEHTNLEERSSGTPELEMIDIQNFELEKTHPSVDDDKIAAPEGNNESKELKPVSPDDESNSSVTTSPKTTIPKRVDLSKVWFITEKYSDSIM